MVDEASGWEIIHKWPKGCTSGIPMAMNSGQDASPRSPDAEVANDDAETDLDPDIDTESLQRSRDAIDEGREAAREALPDDADAAGDSEG